MALAVTGDDSDRTRDVAGVEVTGEHVSYAGQSFRREATAGHFLLLILLSVFAHYDGGPSAIARRVPDMAIARFPSLVVDCPDPGALAAFYGAMLDWKVEVSPGWAEVRADGQCICFQQVQPYTRPDGQLRRCPSRCTSTSSSMTSTPPRRR